MSDRVVIERTDGIVEVRLNRPEKLNALDLGLMRAVVDAGESLKGDRSVRVVVLTGAGRGFCAGLDLSMFESMAAGDGGDGGAGVEAVFATDGRATHLGQQAAWVWRELEVPVIAALHGPVLGGGLQIALGADLRIVHPDATLSVMEARWGLVPDMTGTEVLPRLVGLERAKELTFTARTLDGREAVAIGLASRLSDSPRDDALALARELAARNPDALAHAKRLLEGSPARTPAEQFAAERESALALIGSPNQLEAVAANLERRAPRFT